ncbi:MAG: prolipoprotein diacylglyceryl transferase [Dehalococcoidales bacterium]|nr:prolipoprotein diacylglyceryl transferase [Dehalococcoidales bacterium]
MNGIVINIDPVALNLGHLHITWYSLIVSLAIIVAITVAIYEAKRRGITPDKIFGLAPWAISGGLLGARLFHVIDHWSYYASNPLQTIAFWLGGLAIWGALIGGGIATLIYTRLNKIPFLFLADTLVPALLTAQIIGRFACIIDGDAVGGITSLPWAFIYLNPGAMVPDGLLGVPVHPYPVYDQIWNLLGLGIALKLRHHLKISGQLFMVYLSIYAVGRFVFSFVRQENIWFWGLQEAQVLALIILVFSVGMLIYLFKKAAFRDKQNSIPINSGQTASF